MPRVFADTNYFIAFLNVRDELHDRALACLSDHVNDEIVTSTFVLIELLNEFSSKGSFLRSVAATFVYRALNGGATVVSGAALPDFEEVLQRYTATADKSWSFTDCARFIIMESRGIRDALAHDRHFEQAGFRALMR